MADYTTQAMTGASLAADVLTTDAPPAGALSWAIPDGQGGFIEIALADLGDGGGSGSADIARDPLAVGDVLSITKAVTDPSNIWTNGDLVSYGTPALQDAGAPAAVSGQHNSILVGSADVVTLDEFDYPDAGGAGSWRCRYARRTDGTSGWTRIPKG